MSEQHKSVKLESELREGIAFPVCPHCGTDPAEIMRLRYDFDDGVVVETLFCAKPECRALFGAQIVGVERKK
jgi:hypothetical protein